MAGAYSSFLGPDPLALLFVVILTSLGTWGLPQMVGKFYAIKSEKDIHKGTVISTVFAIIVAGEFAIFWAVSEDYIVIR